MLLEYKFFRKFGEGLTGGRPRARKKGSGVVVVVVVLVVVVVVRSIIISVRAGTGSQHQMKAWQPMALGKILHKTTHLENEYSLNVRAAGR